MAQTLQVHRLLVPLGNYFDIFGHSCVEVQDKIYVFFGNRKDETSLNYMFEYNLIENKWEKKSISYTPRNRAFQSAISFGQNIYFFGGKINGYVNEMHLFSFGTLKIVTWQMTYSSLSQ